MLFVRGSFELVIIVSVIEIRGSITGLSMQRRWLWGCRVNHRGMVLTVKFFLFVFSTSLLTEFVLWSFVRARRLWRDLHMPKVTFPLGLSGWVHGRTKLLQYFRFRELSLTYNVSFSRRSISKSVAFNSCTRFMYIRMCLPSFWYTFLRSTLHWSIDIRDSKEYPSCSAIWSIEWHLSSSMRVLAILSKYFAQGISPSSAVARFWPFGMRVKIGWGSCFARHIWVFPLVLRGKTIAGAWPCRWRLLYRRKELRS